MDSNGIFTIYNLDDDDKMESQANRGESQNIEKIKQPYVLPEQYDRIETFYHGKCKIDCVIFRTLMEIEAKTKKITQPIMKG